MIADPTITMAFVALGKRVEKRLEAQIYDAFKAAGVSRKVVRPTPLVVVHVQYELAHLAYKLTVESRVALGRRSSKIFAYQRHIDDNIPADPLSLKFQEDLATTALGAALGEQLTQVLNAQPNAYDQLPLPWRTDNADTYT